jgi:alpha-D-xyloside xylohydrolase
MQLAAGVAARAPATEVGKLDATTHPYEVPPAVREVKDQYMFGDSLLVAPIPPGVKSRTVLLPPGKWYDFHTGRFAGENQAIEVTPDLATMPVFARDGALIPMIGSRLHAPAAGETVALEVRHYGEVPGSLSLYDDDGETFDFEKGRFSWTGLAVAMDASGQWQGTVTPDANGRKWSYGDVKWTFMTGQ